MEIDWKCLWEAIEKICKAVFVCCMDFEEAMKLAANMIRTDAEKTAREMEELAALIKKAERLDLQTKREQKERRERRRVVERANEVRFSQYKARESAWTAQKRTGQRRREWRGPDRT